ncbi:MAG: ABC transporter permease [Sphingomonadales bacterium]|nr:ABC transporter permease [Sphingomonadales bacterium]MDE2171529.1 ABC transporter permease [Sphingomonadales bacterium]
MAGTETMNQMDMFLTGIKTQGFVIRALMLRELQQRFGRSNIGYLWVVAEPMLLASVITLLNSVVEHNLGTGISPFTFTLTGYSIYIIFRNTFNRSEGALHASGALLYHRMVTPFDIILSKSLVETLGCMSALLILQSAGIMAGVAELPARPIYLLGALALFSWWSFALSLIAASYAYTSPFIGRMIHPISYFSLPLSGAFVTMSILPPWTHPYLALNPMVSVFEMARYGQFTQAPYTYVDIGYVVSFSTIASYWGLLAIRRIRKHIHVA